MKQQSPSLNPDIAIPFFEGESSSEEWELEDWQVEAVRKAIERIDRGEATFYSHEEVTKWVKSL